MSLPGIIIEGGITIDGGISIGAGSGTLSLTINPGDFSNGSMNIGTNIGTNSFTLTQTGRNLVDPFYFLYTPTGSIATTITDFFTACGYDINYAYAFNAVFASAQIPAGGSTTTPYSGLIRASWSGTYFNMIVIDQTNTGWQGGNPAAGSALPGQFVLPVILTPYTPATQLGNNGNWC